MSADGRGPIENAVDEFVATRQREARTRYIGVIGAVSYGLILGAIVRYAQHKHSSLEAVVVCLWFAGPILFGTISGVMRPHAPLSTALILSALHLVGVAPLLGEGAICVLIMAPVFIVISLPLAWIVAYFSRKGRRNGPKPTIPTMLLLIMPGAAAALDPYMPWKPAPVVTVTSELLIKAPRQDVWDKLSVLELRWTQPAPWLIRWMLPEPLAIKGQGVRPGDIREVFFSNGILFGHVTRSDPPHSFAFNLRSQGNEREFFDHWARLAGSTFVLKEASNGYTLISHVTRYEPRAYPRWYFAPFERFFANEIQGYMLRAFDDQMFRAEDRRVANAR